MLTCYKDSIMVWLESLLDTLSDTGVCFSDEVFDQESHSLHRANWLENLKKHENRGLFKTASIGRTTTSQNNQQIRSDQISWLEDLSADDAVILAELNRWRSYLNKNLFLSMRTTECHFARYDSGHFYLRHKDRHDSSNSRILSFVVYLHSSWKPGDGGELVITDGDTEKVKQIIAPLPGRVVIFRSDDIWHEVQKSVFTRYSLTGWFRHDANAFTPPG